MNRSLDTLFDTILGVRRLSEMRAKLIGNQSVCYLQFGFVEAAGAACGVALLVPSLAFFARSAARFSRS